MASLLNKYSRQITQNPSHAGAQAMLLATGLRETDLEKPQVGIAAMWWEGNPCNMHLNDLAARVRTAWRQRGWWDCGSIRSG